MAEQWEEARESARRTVARASELAHERMGRGVYTKADTTRLRDGLAAADDALLRLAYCLDALADERPSLALEAWHNVEALFDAAFVVGGLSEISDTADNLVVGHETNVRKPKRARDAKGFEDAARSDALKRAILDCVAGDSMRLSSYADGMKPDFKDVRESLPRFLPSVEEQEAWPAKGWPSKGTVLKAIRELKKR